MKGIIRRHQVLVHDRNVTNQNIILGFESDVQKHTQVLESKGQSQEKVKCDECEYKNLQWWKINNAHADNPIGHKLYV